jgi:hypothetical protein
MFKFVAALGVSAILTGCAGGFTHHTAAKAPAPTRAPEAVSLAAIRGQFVGYETALEKAPTSGLASLPSNATGPQILARFQPLIAAAQKFEAELTGMAWPAAIGGDAHNLITQVASEVGVLQGVAAQNILSVDTWISQLDAADAATNAATNVVRHDLGLPPLAD